MANKSIREESYYKNFQKFLKEDDEVLGQKGVVPLSKVDPEAAKAAIGTGTKDGNQQDDTAAGGKVTVSAADLRASQTEIIPGKALGMAFGMLKSGKIGGDLESIISADNFIMDGHHRWAGTFLCDPQGKIIATKIDLPGPVLVSALNVVTAGEFGKSGNPGKGNIAEFKGSVLGPMIDELLAKGITGEYPQSPEEVKTNLGKVPGANGDANKGKEIMMKNADALPKEIMPGAPARVEMPVIDKDKVASVAAKFKSGEYDFKPPYSPEVKKALGMESISRNLRKKMISLREQKIEKSILIGESALKKNKKK